MTEVKKTRSKKKIDTLSEKPKTLSYFFPYQKEWLANKSDIKIWEKSRRIGATYVQSYEDVDDCLSGAVPAVWFSSSDETAAVEYIKYCAMWAKVFSVAAEPSEEIVFDDDKKAIKIQVIDFANGSRINALTSNPNAFRSKGGKVVLDEFAHHKNAYEMWEAASPAATWGYPIRILSTHKGKSSLFFEMVQDAEKNGYSLHTTTIHAAVEQGLADKICKKKLTPDEREEWKEKIKKRCVRISVWNQEYECKAGDDAEAWLTYGQIVKATNKSCIHAIGATPTEVKSWISPRTLLYLGMDVARSKHLSIIWVLAVDADFHMTLAIVEMQNTKFHVQQEVLFSFLEIPQMQRACIDATGLGMNLAENAVLAFGEKVEAVTFSNAMNNRLAQGLYLKFEDGHIAIPPGDIIRDDLHSVKRLVSDKGSIRFDQDKNNKEKTDGHADRFWALALAVHAANSSPTPFTPKSGRKREMSKSMKGYM